MRTKKLVLSYSWQYKILHYLFIFCGGKFYLDYILPTNPSSKNPLLKLIWKKSNGGKIKPTSKYIITRIVFAFIYSGVHIICWIEYFNTYYSSFTVSNILINIYPIIVQIYVGLRCWRITKLRKKESISKFEIKEIKMAV